MFRWFVRFSGAALLGALLVWFWNRYNEDLLEEEIDEEIPLEFEVSAQDVLAPGNLEGNGAAHDQDPAAVNVPEATATEAVEPAETPTAEPAAKATTTGSAAEVSTEAAEEVPAETPAAADAGADNTNETQELLLDSPAPTPEGAGDNVTAIRGIGPKYSEKLAEMGITTFGALLGTSIDALAIAFPRVSDEELQSWMEQARELAGQSGEPA